MNERLRKIVAEAFPDDSAELNADTKFEDLGADSLELVEVIMACEDEFQICISNSDAEGILSIGQLQAVIEKEVKL